MPSWPPAGSPGSLTPTLPAHTFRSRTRATRARARAAPRAWGPRSVGRRAPQCGARATAATRSEPAAASRTDSVDPSSCWSTYVAASCRLGGPVKGTRCVASVRPVTRTDCDKVAAHADAALYRTAPSRTDSVMPDLHMQTQRCTQRPPQERIL
eukprot:350454-Chlamydomonas_euryale.AAC.2